MGPDDISTLIITARKRSLGQGNVFTPVCHSCSQEGGWVCPTPLDADPSGLGRPSLDADPPGCRPPGWGRSPMDADPLPRLGRGPWMHTPGLGRPPDIDPQGGQNPLDADPPGVGQTSPIRSTSGRYASYWNAYLLDLYSKIRIIVIAHCT